MRQRRRSAAHVRRCVCPRRCRGLTEDVTARAVRLCHCCERRGRCYVGALETRYYGSGASESVEGEVRRADPLSVNPGQRPGREDEEICTAGRCRCRCIAGVPRRRRSAAHQCRADVLRRCRGLTERRDRSRGHTLLLLREAMRSAGRGRAGGGVAHLRCAEGVGRL